MVRPWCFLYVLNCKCASRHSGVPFLDSWTSKGAPKLVCFVHFDFGMCFSLLRRAIFRHLNFQKCSGTVSFFAFWLEDVLRATAACNFSTSELPKVLRDREIFLAFWLENVLRATAACNFSTSELPKMLRDRQSFSIFTWKCASHQSGVQFFLSALSSYLRTRRFSEPTFRPSRHTDHRKNIAVRDFPNISCLCIFFLLTFAQLNLLSSDSTSLLCFSSSDSTSLLWFQLSILSEVSLLNFLWSIYINMLKCNMVSPTPLFNIKALSLAWA